MRSDPLIGSTSPDESSHDAVWGLPAPLKMPGRASMCLPLVGPAFHDARPPSGPQGSRVPAPLGPRRGSRSWGLPTQPVESVWLDHSVRPTRPSSCGPCDGRRSVRHDERVRRRARVDSSSLPHVAQPSACRRDRSGPPHDAGGATRPREPGPCRDRPATRQRLVHRDQSRASCRNRATIAGPCPPAESVWKSGAATGSATDGCEHHQKVMDVNPWCATSNSSVGTSSAPTSNSGPFHRTGKTS